MLWKGTLDVELLEATTLGIDTDTDESDPWLGLKKEEGVRDMFLNEEIEISLQQL
jgi:hypothetical protein